MGNPADTIEAELWSIYDTATDIGSGKLPRNSLTGTDPTSRKHKYRTNLEKGIVDGKWTPAARAEVETCVKKAGHTTRVLADFLGLATIDLPLFNLACQITEEAYAIDLLSSQRPGARGLVC